MKVQRVIFFLFAVITTLMFAREVLATQETSVILSFTEGQLLFDQAHGYDRIRLADGDVLSRLGQPTLPTQQVLVAIPPGGKAVAVRVRSLASQELPGVYRIFPGQPARRLDGDLPPGFVDPDERIYSSAQVYPGELGRLAGQTDLAGQQMAVVTVYPLQYVPVSGRLVFHQKMAVTVESRPGYVSRESYAKFTEKQRKVYQERVQGMVVNPQDVVLNPPLREVSKTLPAGQFDHVVITSESYLSFFDDLVEWHNKRGLRDTVVSTAYIYANYGGSGDEERIRNFVIDAQSTWGTLYYLMGGEDGAVPFKYRTYHNENTPSDNYYADYDDDWTCEVFVGRIPGASSTQFSTAIDKILKYERDPPVSDYPLDVLLIGMDLDSSTPGEQLKETIDGYIPARFDVNKVYDSHSGNHLDATLAYLNAGQNLVNHNDHANNTVLGIGSVNHGLSLNMFHVNGLTNDGKASNIVSTGCWPNDMTYNDCIAEHFIISNPNQAGVSFTGNTRDGWYYVGYPEGLSGQLDRDWWRGVFQSGQDNLGKALVWSKHNFNQNTSGTHRHCEWTFCLLGEPSMPIWTDTPESLDVNHATTLPVGNSSLLVHVESGGSDLSGAYVCLWKPGEVYLTGHTDSNGDVTLNPSPTTPDTLFVTVTKHNYLPYEGVAQVNASGPPPAISDLEIDLSQGDLILTWTAPEEKEVVRYVIYRDQQGDFSPAPEDSIAGTTDTTYTDVGATGMVGTNYYYVVKAVNHFGEKSDPSNTVGEYDINLIREPAK